LQSSIELEQFSTVVEKIYDAALDRDAWPEALKSVAKFVGGSGSTITFGNVQAENLEALMVHSIGLSEEFLKGFQKYGPIWAAQSGIAFWNVGEVNHLPDFAPQNELIQSRFYKEHLRPHNQGDFMGLVALRDGSRFAPVTISRELDAGPFSQHAVQSMRLLAPHICKAVKISFAVELKQLSANMLEQTLNSLSSGIFLLNRDSRIMFMNTVAEQQSKHRRGLTIVNYRLELNDSTAAAQFRQAMSGDDEKRVAPTSIALPNENGGLIATIIRLDKGRRQNLARGANPPVFAVFLQNPELATPSPGEGFAKLFGLTQAESRTLMTLSMSKGPQDAAEILGVSITTIRSHLQHVFAKTSTSSQSELMQLMMRSAAPVIAQ
jgi:DNA-binding CsgD family transcriptional regulator/PAS domain-containing protein